MSLSQRHKIIFYEKRAPLLEQNVTKNTHAKEDVFHFDSLRFADDGFCAQKDRRELARVQVRVRVRMMSLSLRVISFSFFFFFFFNIFSPLFWVCKWTREDEALWMWTLSLVGCASRVGIDRSDRERRKRERGRRVVLLLLFFGRTDAFARCSIERGGCVDPIIADHRMTYLLFVSKWISFETRFDSMLFTTMMMMIKQTERSKPRRRRKRNSPRSNAAGRKPATRRSGKMPRRRRKQA